MKLFPVLAFALLVGPAYSQEVLLGGPAPELRVGNWYRGHETSQYQKGKIYVVELWATWCVYCIKAMPHLNELSQELKDKVEFVGVDVKESQFEGTERTAFEDKKIADFLSKGVGATLKYDVCVDGVDRFTEKQWMPLAAQAAQPTGGIPLTFIVDQEGRLAWIGHPYDKGLMEKALRQMVAGTYDLPGYLAECKQAIADNNAREAENRAKYADKKAARAAAVAPIITSITEALKNQDYANALVLAHGAVDADPSLMPDTLRLRVEAYRSLLRVDEPKALEAVQWEKAHAKPTVSDPQIKDYFPNRDRNYLAILEVFANANGLSSKAYDFTIGEMETFRLEMPVIEERICKSYADVCIKAGQADKGLKLVQSLIEFHKKNGFKYDEWTAEMQALQAAKKG